MTCFSADGKITPKLLKGGYITYRDGGRYIKQVGQLVKLGSQSAPSALIDIRLNCLLKLGWAIANSSHVPAP